jgi:HPt (histidine-containing phosphotransfer) domain-containing protein
VSRLDTEALQARFQGKRELLRKLFFEFSSFVEAALPRMKAAYDAGDLETLQETAHTLKGNAALIGAGRVSDLALGVQQASANGDIQVLMSSLPELNSEARLALDELKSFVAVQE